MTVRQSPLNWNFNSETHSKPVIVGSHQFIQKYSLVNALRSMSLQSRRLESGATKKSATLPPLLTNSKAPQIIRITDKDHSQSVRTDHDRPRGHPTHSAPSQFTPARLQKHRDRGLWLKSLCRTMHNVSCRWKNPLPS